MLILHPWIIFQQVFDLTTDWSLLSRDICLNERRASGKDRVTLILWIQLTWMNHSKCQKEIVFLVWLWFHLQECLKGDFWTLNSFAANQLWDFEQIHRMLSGFTVLFSPFCCTWQTDGHESSRTLPKALYMHLHCLFLPAVAHIHYQPMPPCVMKLSLCQVCCFTVAANISHDFGRDNKSIYTPLMYFIKLEGWAGSNLMRCWKDSTKWYKW